MKLTKELDNYRKVKHSWEYVREFTKDVTKRLCKQLVRAVRWMLLLPN